MISVRLPERSAVIIGGAGNRELQPPPRTPFPGELARSCASTAPSKGYQATSHSPSSRPWTPAAFGVLGSSRQSNRWKRSRSYFAVGSIAMLAPVPHEFACPVVRRHAGNASAKMRAGNTEIQVAQVISTFRVSLRRTHGIPLVQVRRSMEYVAPEKTPSPFEIQRIDDLHSRNGFLKVEKLFIKYVECGFGGPNTPVVSMQLPENNGLMLPPSRIRTSIGVSSAGARNYLPRSMQSPYHPH